MLVLAKNISLCPVYSLKGVGILQLVIPVHYPVVLVLKLVLQVCPVLHIKAGSALLLSLLPWSVASVQLHAAYEY